MKIQIILASTRPGRLGKRVAKWVLGVAGTQPGLDVELVDLRDYALPLFNEPASPRFNPHREPEPVVARWLAKVAAADGYLMVTPEYNHSVPGALKNALDYLDFQLAKKPVAIVSYGSVGGARAAEHLKGILIEVKAAVVPEAVAIIGAANLIDEHGRYTGDPGQGPAAVLPGVLHELAWWTATLKAGRE